MDLRNGAQVQTRPTSKTIPLLAALVIAFGANRNCSAGAEVAAHFAAGELPVAESDPRVMTGLAVRYEYAEGMPKDLQKAASLYCSAAKRGYAEAQFRLGWIYANGRGVKRDDAVAADLFAMAANSGHEHALKLLKYIPKRSDAQLPSCLLPDPDPALPLASIDPSGDADSGSDGARIDPPSAGNRNEIERLVHDLSPLYEVDSALALALVSVESAFNPMAVSPKNALGLMQLIPQTAGRFGVKRVFDPADNIKGGLAYLRWLLAFFQGDVPLVLAAYNAGERAVEKYRGIPPYPETREYVKRITSLYKKARHPYQSGVVAPSPIMGQIRRNQGYVDK